MSTDKHNEARLQLCQAIHLVEAVAEKLNGDDQCDASMALYGICTLLELADEEYADAFRHHPQAVQAMQGEA